MLVNNILFSPWICLFSSAGQQVPADVLLSPKPAKIMKREEAPAADPCLSQLSPNLSRSARNVCQSLMAY